jgi:adenylate cyclase
LIDALTGNHLWAERYDRDLKDIFAVQDEITMRIMGAMQLKLTEGEQTLRGKLPRNLEAYLKLLQSRDQAGRFTKEGNILARRYAEEAIALDPKYVGAYLRLSATHIMDLRYGTTESPEQSLRRAEECVLLRCAMCYAAPETEWVETVAAGWKRLAWRDATVVLDAAHRSWPNEPSAMAPSARQSSTA